jgi:hypothetical protein
MKGRQKGNGHKSEFSPKSEKELLIRWIVDAFLRTIVQARINKQEIVEEKSDSFVFRMIDCRVQASRRLKGLEDYPCKSIGIIEYRTFAGTIDSRIQTECIGCPPDPPQPGWYCAWKFSLR